MAVWAGGNEGDGGGGEAGDRTGVQTRRCVQRGGMELPSGGEHVEGRREEKACKRGMGRRLTWYDEFITLKR